MSEKTCCVTGNREIPADKVEYVKTKLREEIEIAIADGYTTFVSGLDEGVDLLFAQLVIEQKEYHPHLFLEAAIPYNSRLKSEDPLFHTCFRGCNGIYIQQNEYSTDCYMNRNRYMVGLADRVIAVYNNLDKSSTLFTMRYAHTIDKEVREILI